MFFFNWDAKFMLANLGLIEQQSLAMVNFHYNIYSTKVICVYLINSEDTNSFNFCLFVNNLQCYLPTVVYPSTTTLVVSQDPVSSSSTVDIGVDIINAYGASSSCYDFF
jgi:hypothetical protein